MVLTCLALPCAYLCELFNAKYFVLYCLSVCTDVLLYQVLRTDYDVLFCWSNTISSRVSIAGAICSHQKLSLFIMAMLEFLQYNRLIASFVEIESFGSAVEVARQDFAPCTLGFSRRCDLWRGGNTTCKIQQHICAQNYPQYDRHTYKLRPAS